MARFFKYKSADELTAAASELGQPIECVEDLSVLAQPTSVAGRTVGNRIAIHPMEGCDGELDGSPGDLTLRRFIRFGAGGAKLIWGEATAVRTLARANPRQLFLHPGNLSLFATLVRETRKAHFKAMGRDDDLLLGLQLTHSGRYGFEKPTLAMRCPVLEARRPADRDRPIISDDDLLRLVDDYVASAKLAQEAGFDFVDVKQCHRYLLSELLAAKERPGRFGGDLENRSAIARLIIARIRDEAPGLIVASRLNVYDAIAFTTGKDGVGVPCEFKPPYRNGFGVDENDPLSMDLSEPIRLVGLLREAGLSLLNVSMGCPYTCPHVIRPAEYPPIDGYSSPEHPLVGVGRHFRATAAIQAAYPDLPVMGSGYSYLQEFLYGVGAANVAAKRATFVGLGRSSLAYPDAPRDLMEGRPLDRKRVCRTFSYCTNLMRSKDHPLGQFPTGCPPFDREAYHDIYESAKSTWRAKES